MMELAILDADGVLRGFAPIADGEELAADAVTVPDDCDLDTAGRYCWRHGAFWPIPRDRDAAARLKQGMAAHHHAGLTDWPQDTLVWIYAYYGSATGGGAGPQFGKEI